MPDQAKVHCENCGNWVSVESAEGRFQCECGQGFLVTITPLPSQAI